MSKIAPFWRFIEVRPSHTAVMAQWQSLVGDHFPSVRRLLMSVGRSATVYPNPRGGSNMKLVYHTDGSIIAIDPSDWQHRIPLKPEDVVLHQLDLRAVRKVLCDTLDGVNIVKSSVDQDAGCVQIGNWEPKKAASFPVYFLSCPSRSDLHCQVLDLQRKCNRPGAILLTPTRDNWDDDLDVLARSRNMLLVSLSDIIETKEAGFLQTDLWEEYLQAFCQMVKLSLPGNYRNKRPIPIRGTRAANIDKLAKAMENHLIAARDHACSLKDRGMEPVLLPRPQQKEFSKLTGLSASDISRCLKDPRAKLLQILWQTAESLDDVMRFKRR